MTCGNGKQISTRKIIQQALNGGLECEGKDTKTKPCKHKKCKGWMIQMKIYSTFWIAILRKISKFLTARYIDIYFSVYYHTKLKHFDEDDNDPTNEG